MDLTDHHHSTRGFTLLELMTVVMIISVLAAVAFPAYSRYMRRSKTTEVYTNIRKVYDGEIVYYQEEHVNTNGQVLSKQFVITDVQPAFPPGIDKQVGNFESPEWSAIHFSADSPLNYVYWADAYPFPSPYPARPTGYDVTQQSPPTGIVAGFRAEALGDLNGDGTFSEFSREAGVPTVGGDIQTNNNTFSLNELE